MTEPVTLTLGQRGVLTLPKALRERYGLQAGDDLTLIDLDGVFVLGPRRLQVDYLADRVGETLAADDATLTDMLQALRRERERNAG
ncbi:MAG: AbrB/MazE/SpoVT family DNA-binding domain-containing protein [Caldilineales bacterium]|nr:AbrB/MazE/SpoVT family DNA-binding domain-containing protein [Caldilineales bacterium]